MTKQDPSITKTQPIPEELIVNRDNKAKQNGRQKHILLSKKVWAAFMTVFISGIAIGAMSIQLYMNNKMRHTPQADRAKIRIISHMSNELNLSPDQKVKAEEIITIMTTQLSELRKEQTPKIQSVIQSSFDDINKLLNKEQKQKFIEMQKRVKSCRGGRGNSGRNMRKYDSKDKYPERKGMNRHKSTHKRERE